MTTPEALVAHIWRRLGFGATRADLDADVAAGPQAVIADLLSRPPVLPSPGTPDPWGFVTANDYTGADQFALRMLELMAFGPITPASYASRTARSIITSGSVNSPRM